MKRDENKPILSAIFVDYDNIYMSLKRKNDEAAKRFAKLAQDWLKGIETGSLITATNGVLGTAQRRIVLNRCYGNPVPRRHGHDNSTDMSSFPFIRHHFLRAGCEVVDCPPLTAQLKNSSDIRMVMDVRDYLTHDTYFDEFVILSGDADFTPVLQRLRQHARRTIIYCNEYTAQPYTAICDGEIREADLIALLLAQDPAIAATGAMPVAEGPTPSVAPAVAASLPDLRAEIIREVIASVRSAPAPVPLEALADRALRVLGHEKTVNSSWAGAGSFRELLRQSLPTEILLSDQPPYFAYDPKRHSGTPPRMPMNEPRMPQPPVSTPARVAMPPAPPTAAQHSAPPPPVRDPVYAEVTQPAAKLPPVDTAMPRQQPEARPMAPPQPPPRPVAAQPAPHAAANPALAPQRPVYREPLPTPLPPLAPHPGPPQQPQISQMQQSIARIYDACQAPALAPAEYRAVFDVLAEEITENSLAGAQTLNNVVARAKARGFELRHDDARFILEVISENDPWFDQGASATLFGGRFRNFVVGRCRSQGLNLSAEELDLIDSWFAGAAPSAALRGGQQPVPGSAPVPGPAQADPRGVARWWPGGQGGGSGPTPEPVAAGAGQNEDDFPRIVRARRV